jgi:hypothetical protein
MRSGTLAGKLDCERESKGYSSVISLEWERSLRTQIDRTQTDESHAQE